LKKLRGKVNDLGELIRISKEFAVKSTLLKDRRVKSLIEKIEKKGDNASMIMLGNAVYSDKPFKGCKKAKINNKGARLL
jgi:pantoate kinase